MGGPPLLTDPDTDVLAVAPVSGGKTLALMIHLVLVALEAETRMPLESGEGPVALLIAPSVCTL